MNFYKRYMADYAKKTARLTLAQHGAYTLLLDEVYASESALPADLTDLFRVCRAMGKAEQDAVRFVAEKFFPVGEDGLRHNPRANQELIEAAPALEAARLNGKRGGRPKKEPSGPPENNPVGFGNTTQTEPNSKPPHSSDNSIAKAIVSPAELPDCPHELLIDLFEKHLPSLAQPKKSLWRSGKNAPAMKARWRWVMTAMHEKGERKGQRLATTKDEAIAWFERYFAYVARSEFLTGTSGEWACDLGWLVNAANFEKVLSGIYENKLKAVA